MPTMLWLLIANAKQARCDLKLQQNPDTVPCRVYEQK